MPKMDIRFNPRLTKEQMDKVKKVAKKNKISWAEVIRRLIDELKII